MEESDKFEEFYVVALLHLCKKESSLSRREISGGFNSCTLYQEQMRGWYLKYANCPEWWLSTGIPWCSPNHQRGEEKHYFSVNELDALIYAYKKRKIEEVGLASKNVYFTLHQHQ